MTRQFSKVKESEIENIVKLVPGSLECDLFQIRPGDLTAFQLGCMNERVPVGVVKILLEAKANPNSTFNGDSYILTLKNFCEMEDIIPIGRYSKIYDLFVEYGLDKSLHSNLSFGFNVLIDERLGEI